MIMVSQVFYRGLLPHLDEKAATVIFANVEDILLTNTVSEAVPLLNTIDT